MPRVGKEKSPHEPLAKRKRRQIPNPVNQPNVKVRKPQRTWSVKETTIILDYLKATVSGGGEIEKPKAPIYYKHFLQKNRESENEEDRLSSDITVPMIITHVNNVKKSYKTAYNWSNATGEGILENMGEQTFRGLLLKKCRYWDLTEEIWGHRTNIKIPVAAETTQVGPSRHLSTPSEFGSDGDDDNDAAYRPSSRSISRERSRSPFRNSPGRIMSPELPSPEGTDAMANTQGSRVETPTRPKPMGSYSRRRSKTRVVGHPGRKLDRGGEKLTKSFYHKGPKDLFEDMVHQREVNEGQKLKIQEEQLKIQQQQAKNDSRRMDEELELKRQEFEYKKTKDTQALELEREITRRQEIKLDQMKIKLELAKLGIQTNDD